MVHDLVVAPAEEMIPETLRDGGPDFQDLGDVFPTDHHVPVVELHVHVRLLVQQVIGAAGRSETDQLPEITEQLMAARSLQNKPMTSGQSVHTWKNYTFKYREVILILIHLSG